MSGFHRLGHILHKHNANITNTGIMELVLVIAWICVQLKNNCTSNSRIITRGEAEYNFDCYEYNYSLIAR